MAAVMTFVSKIENDSSSLYQDCAEKLPGLRDHFLSWVKENESFEKRVKRTYFGVITDTLESNFAFEGLDTDDYPLQLTLPGDADVPQIKNRAIETEKTIMSFYLEAAQLSESLMADIPRLFKKIAKKRQERAEIIGSL
jgi:hypothetical protein